MTTIGEGTSLTWRPDWTVEPGAIMAETLRDRGMSQAELARRTGRPLKAINEIVKGKAAITAETAVQLEAALGVPARFWMNLQRDFDEGKARAKRRQTLAVHTLWSKKFPLAAMAKHKLLPRTPSAVEQVEALLEFFGVATPDAWREQWQRPAAAFRRSPTRAPDVEAVSAWLRWGQRIALKQDIREFDVGRLSAMLQTVRSLALLSPIVFRRRLVEMLGDAGVVILYLPELPGTRIIGAAHWTGNHPIIQLSLRHKTDDHFWFAVFHEIGHVVDGRRGGIYVDFVGESGTSEDEGRADAFAREVLLPRSQFDAFVEARGFSARSIRAFAEVIGTTTGIVVGRLQHDRYLGPGALAYLKTEIDWAA